MSKKKLNIAVAIMGGTCMSKVPLWAQAIAKERGREYPEHPPIINVSNPHIDIKGRNIKSFGIAPISDESLHLFNGEILSLGKKEEGKIIQVGEGAKIEYVSWEDQKKNHDFILGSAYIGNCKQRTYVKNMITPNIRLTRIKIKHKKFSRPVLMYMPVTCAISYKNLLQWLTNDYNK